MHSLAALLGPFSYFGFCGSFLKHLSIGSLQRIEVTSAF